ncbi:MAG: hypothetical protein ACFFBS_03915 [Promethearchaeota archaeon]
MQNKPPVLTFKDKSGKVLHITEKIVWIPLAEIYPNPKIRYATLPKEAFLLGEKPFIDSGTERENLSVYYENGSWRAYMPRDLRTRGAKICFRTRAYLKEYIRNPTRPANPPYITDLEDLLDKDFHLETQPKLEDLAIKQAQEWSKMEVPGAAITRVLNLFLPKDQKIERHNLRKMKSKNIKTFMALKRFFNTPVRITRIGDTAGGGIRNPKLPFDLSNQAGVDILAGWSTDGTLGKHQFTMGSKDREFLDLIDKDVKQVFGDIKCFVTEYPRKRSIIYTYSYNGYPVNITLQRAGAVKGSKVEKNVPLPQWIQKAKKELQQRWMSVVLTAEGSSALQKDGYKEGRHRLSIQYVRGVRLDLDERLKQLFLKNKDRCRVVVFPERSATCYRLTFKRARMYIPELIDEIMNNPSKMIIDEAAMIESWGLKVSVRPRSVSYYTKSRNVNALWISQVVRDAKKLENLCPFLIGRKKNKFLEFERKKSLVERGYLIN